MLKSSFICVYCSDSEDDRDLAVFLEDLDSSERADNINEAIAGYDARDEARICRFTKSDGTCFKGKNCKLEHLPLPKGKRIFREKQLGSDCANMYCNEFIFSS